LKSLLGAPSTDARQASPPPRRVGLRSADQADIDAVEAMLLDEPMSEETAAERRRAFGQRQEAAHEPLPVLRLAAPMALLPKPGPDADVAEVLRRRSLKLAPVALSPAETPFHPEDLSDTHEGHAEQIYADSGLFEPEPAPAAEETDPERALLARLEGLFLTEMAALAARRA
jgi:hypothetical protein